MNDEFKGNHVTAEYTRIDDEWIYKIHDSKDNAIRSDKTE